MAAAKARRRLAHFAGVIVMTLWAIVGSAQSSPAQLTDSTRSTPLRPGGDVIAMPSVGRILGGFILTVGLAVGAAYAFKRYLPQFAQRLSTNSQVGISARTVVQNGVRYHIVTVEEHTVLVAEGRSGVAMTVLPGKTSGTTA